LRQKYTHGQLAAGLLTLLTAITSGQPANHSVGRSLPSQLWPSRDWGNRTLFDLHRRIEAHQRHHAAYLSPLPSSFALGRQRWTKPWLVNVTRPGHIVGRSMPGNLVTLGGAPLRSMEAPLLLKEDTDGYPVLATAVAGTVGRWARSGPTCRRPRR